MKNATFTIALSAALAACHSVPNNTDLANANLGDPPSQALAETLANAYLKAVLLDPESARVEFGGELRKAWYRDIFAPPKFAWQLDAMCNAKNAFGGYTGRQPFAFYFIGPGLVAVKSDGSIEELGDGGLTREQAGLLP